MQEGYEDIRTEGAELIAISTDPLTLVDSTQQSLEITYPLLSDENRETVAAYNVIDPSDTDIARPATYIVDQNGRIIWKFLDTQGAGRLSSERVLTELKNL